jgi:hypothetical protein
MKNTLAHKPVAGNSMLPVEYCLHKASFLAISFPYSFHSFHRSYLCC